VVETALVVDVATKYSCNCTKNCIFKVWTFKQLYTIRVPFKDVTGTAVYAFLPNKCQDTYRELFQPIV
jgi:hypothetical protein